MRLLYHGIGLYRPGQAIGPARWEHHDLIVVLSGGISLRVQGQARVLEESDGLVIPPGHLFEGGSEADQSRIWVLHYAREDGDPRGPFFIRKAPREIRKGFAAGFPRDLLDEFTDCWNATRSSGKTRFAKLLAQTLFAKVSVQLKTNTPSIPKRLQAAIHVPLSGKGPVPCIPIGQSCGAWPKPLPPGIQKSSWNQPFPFPSPLPNGNRAPIACRNLHAHQGNQPPGRIFGNRRLSPRLCAGSGNHSRPLPPQPFIRGMNGFKTNIRAGLKP